MIPALKPEELSLLSQIARCGEGDFCHVQELNYNSQDEITVLVTLGVVEAKQPEEPMGKPRWFRVSELGKRALASKGLIKLHGEMVMLLEGGAR